MDRRRGSGYDDPNFREDVYQLGVELGIVEEVQVRVPTRGEFDQEFSDEQLQEFGPHFAVRYLMFRPLWLEFKALSETLGVSVAVRNVMQKYFADGGLVAMKPEVEAKLRVLFAELIAEKGSLDGAWFVTDLLRFGLNFVPRAFMAFSGREAEREAAEFTELRDGMIASLRAREDEVRAEQGLGPVNWDSDDLPPAA